MVNNNYRTDKGKYLILPITTNHKDTLARAFTSKGMNEDFLLVHFPNQLIIEKVYAMMPGYEAQAAISDDFYDFLTVGVILRSVYFGLPILFTY
ncbi:hypothetical protein XELAEV_18007913mg [Xenopus laevis]|uniref:Uncharacterized protein n=1 Tax=Xenopus laevis TaxID=8355 RepID=A0A974I5U5_XENLA|nr:hypothetical protein XELAEV_18007913mg [Xenopus laevis]